MLWGLKCEGNTAMLDYMASEGINVRKHRVEFGQYEPFLIGGRGIEIDMNGETNIKGLYAAGDEVGNFRADMSGAATYGWVAGGSAAQRVGQASAGADIADHPVTLERASQLSGFMDRENGASWQEANLAVQQIMKDYAGVEVRSETLLSAGLKYLGDLKRNALETMSANNAHTLMRCLEVLDLVECGNIVMQAALARKETRERHIRSDFPFTNPLLQDKFLTIHQENGQIKTDWRKKR